MVLHLIGKYLQQGILAQNMESSARTLRGDEMIRVSHQIDTTSHWFGPRF